jgi:tRNA U34 5-methylaminomethyl-2-thiouridine-forming methyltransferase MnmC
MIGKTTYELIATEDGSWTCYDLEHDQLFHNKAGAYTEALQNYCEPSNALSILIEHSNLKILDACFGLGYNSFVLLNEILKQKDSIQQQSYINILGLETNEASLENIPHILNNERFSYLNQELKTQTVNKFGISHIETNNLEITIEIRQADLRKAVPNLLQSFHLIFHDPFSASKAPHLWTVDLFKHYYRLLIEEKGKLLTYSSAANVRSGLREAGFILFKTKPLGRKNGGTLAATKSNINIDDKIFSLSEEEIIKSISDIPYRDPDFVSTVEQIFQTRQNEIKQKK